MIIHGLSGKARLAITYDGGITTSRRGDNSILNVRAAIGKAHIIDAPEALARHQARLEAEKARLYHELRVSRGTFGI